MSVIYHCAKLGEFMTESRNVSEIKRLEQQIVKWQLVGVGGAVILALGLYGIFGAHGHVFYKPLADKDVAWSLLVVGLVVVVWQYRKTYTLVKELARLRQREHF